LVGDGNLCVSSDFKESIVGDLERFVLDEDEDIELFLMLLELLRLRLLFLLEEFESSSLSVSCSNIDRSSFCSILFNCTDMLRRSTRSVLSKVVRTGDTGPDTGDMMFFVFNENDSGGDAL
tara:strand:+ start:119 stop:481 length:363 start_codon:yes stop_codon:yes gene_type:complete